MIALVKLLKKIPIKEAHIFVGFFFLSFSCSSPSSISKISGYTMGTSYIIKINAEVGSTVIEGLKFSIDSLLIDLNKKLSTWDINSEVTRFNNSFSLKGFSLSNDFMNVLKCSQKIASQTDGYFDVTIFDLMSFWGFGPSPQDKPFKIDKIKSILNYTGYNFLKLEEKAYKLNPLLKVDLNAIAKGYGVDKVFQFISDQGFDNFLIEIGGEVRAQGINSSGNLWMVGIEPPILKKQSQTKFAAIIELNGNSMATSGNYRNYIEHNGKILGHTINPKIGYPINSNILSVTTFAESCMVADAWATALMTMEYEKGLEFLKKVKGVNALWVLDEDGVLKIKKYGEIKIIDSIYAMSD